MLVLFSVLASGCAAHGPQIGGRVGAIEWHVTDVGRQTRTGYPFTLVLTDVQGIGMQLRRLAGGPRCVARHGVRSHAVPVALVGEYSNYCLSARKFTPSSAAAPPGHSIA